MIRIPPELPNAVLYRRWILSIKLEVSAASSRPDAAFKWVCEVEQNGTAFPVHPGTYYFVSFWAV